MRYEIPANLCALRERVTELIAQQLPGIYVYHDIRHTLDVLECVLHYGEVGGLTAPELRMLAAAALLHDVGFIHGHEQHEMASCKIAGELLPEHGFENEEIASIQGMIQATRPAQTPLHKLEALLCDADLDYLGRADYITLSNRLRQEMEGINGAISDGDWQAAQLNFLRGHTYHSSVARELREQGKRENLMNLQHALGPPAAL